MNARWIVSQLKRHLADACRLGWLRTRASHLVLAIVAAGCAAGTPAPPRNALAKAEQQPVFFGDYTPMTAGPKGSAMLYYVNPHARWLEYDKLILDPITLWRGESGVVVAPDQQQDLCDYMQAVLKDHLARVFTLVNNPGPGVMRLHVTITDADGAASAYRTVAADRPPAELRENMRRLASVTYEFAGVAESEGEVTDTINDEHLFAWIDRRVGGGSLNAAAQWTWKDTKAAIDYWAETLAGRLAQWHQEGDVAG
jgi:Protein of unknown function (DUF3313)